MDASFYVRDEARFCDLEIVVNLVTFLSFRVD